MILLLASQCWAKQWKRQTESKILKISHKKMIFVLFRTPIGSFGSKKRYSFEIYLKIKESWLKHSEEFLLKTRWEFFKLLFFKSQLSNGEKTIWKRSLLRKYRSFNVKVGTWRRPSPWNVVRWTVVFWILFLSLSLSISFYGKEVTICGEDRVSVNATTRMNVRGHFRCVFYTEINWGWSGGKRY